MKVGYKSIKTILEDYADYSGEELQLQESVILKISEDKGEGNVDVKALQSQLTSTQKELEGLKSLSGRHANGARPVELRRDRLSLPRCRRRYGAVQAGGAGQRISHPRRGTARAHQISPARRSSDESAGLPFRAPICADAG